MRKQDIPGNKDLEKVIFFFKVTHCSQFIFSNKVSSNYLALIAVGSSEQEVGGKMSKTVDMPSLLFLFSV